MIIRFNRSPGRAAGFSLIEVLIAVVVLSSGLLALAALQGSLTRSSAEAKVRSRVAAMLTARMDQLRSSPYEDIASSTDSCAGTPADDWVPASICTESGLGALTATQTVQLWSSTPGGTVFTQGAPGNPGVDPEFKRVLLSATWRDSGNATHSLAMSSDLSTLALNSSLIPSDDSGTSLATGPIVRQETPVEAGVIPIAIGGNQSSAASNPRPEFEGAKNNQTLVGTRFDVLTYSPATETNIVVIQKRIETNVIKCACKYGAADSDFFSQIPAQWPAVWTGEHYEVYKPEPAAVAPGDGLDSGRDPTVPDDEQSSLCIECCRDHHDTATAGVAKYDPIRVVVGNDAHEHYSADSSGVLSMSPVPNTNTSDYVEACRMTRVDGLWRTTADMYSQKFNLLETETVAGVQAETGVPTQAASDGYASFVKSYLQQYDGTVATAPTNATTLFEAVTPSLNDPTLITIAAPSTSDFRFLHARGLYVDYLEADVRAKLVEVLADTGPDDCLDNAPLAECVLPYLPFTTINMTELANWRATEPAVLDVNSRNILNLVDADAEQPSGGASRGVSNGDSDNIAEIGPSNAGVAATAALVTGVDPDDQVLSPDTQPFNVGGVASTGDGFNVRLAGLAGQNPFLSFAIGTDAGTCSKASSGDYRCPTNSTLPGLGSIKFENYGQLTTVTRAITAVCEGFTVTDTIPVPAFSNWRVVDPVQICANDGTGCTTAASPGAPLPDDTGEFAESTSVTLTIPKAPATPTSTDQLVKATFVFQSTRSDATISSCQTNGGHNKIINPVWNPFPWD